MSNILIPKFTTEDIDERAEAPANLQLGELALSGVNNGLGGENLTLWVGMGEGEQPIEVAGGAREFWVNGTMEAKFNQELSKKADKNNVAATVYVPSSTENITYYKISGFGEWGTGTWYQKGVSMFITSRAGELIWLSLSSDDSNTNARAIRLMNTHTKIANIYYSVSENAIYVRCAGWNNFLGAHIISNLLNEYRPTIENVGGLGNDIVEINIIEFGVNSSSVVVGDSTVKLVMNGSETHPTYNGANIALVSDIHTYVEESLVNGRW